MRKLQKLTAILLVIAMTSVMMLTGCKSNSQPATTDSNSSTTPPSSG